MKRSLLRSAAIATRDSCLKRMDTCPDSSVAPYPLGGRPGKAFADNR